ncbi:MAG: ABC transporter ATP-binding protein/permease, partial [Lachnospiraceae bacterium]|nr:ABC transporter ATP-binding protein/permease [Lachnospiraceae bacterium]
AVVCLVLGIYLFDTSHSITGIVLVLIVLCMGTFLYISKKVSKKIGERNQVYQGKLFQWVNQALGGIKEVKVLSREDYFIDAYSENYGKLIKGAKNNELLSAVPKYIVEAVCMTGLLSAIIIKMFWGYKGNTVMDFIPQLAVLAVGAFRLLPSVGKINAFVNNILYSMPSLDLIYNDLKSIEGFRKNDDESDGSASAPEAPAAQEGKDIRIQNVFYHYPDSSENVINGADFTIRGGATTAFIGSSGAGKTTLADIILGLLPPEKGKILYGDTDVYRNLSYWHSRLGYIPQSIYLSDDTILKNVAFGVPEDRIDEKAVIEALKKAQLYDFVKGLPEGLHTFTGDRGVRLSGGQRQRIGIARALYHDPEILVLDEATAALDNETEAAVMDAIDSLHGRKTLLIIAHRLTTIRNADAIYEVADGSVRERTRESVFGEETGEGGAGTAAEE